MWKQITLHLWHFNSSRTESGTPRQGALKPPQMTLQSQWLWLWLRLWLSSALCSRTPALGQLVNGVTSWNQARYTSYTTCVCVDRCDNGACVCVCVWGLMGASQWVRASTATATADQTQTQTVCHFAFICKWILVKALAGIVFTLKRSGKLCRWIYDSWISQKLEYTHKQKR